MIKDMAWLREKINLLILEDSVEIKEPDGHSLPWINAEIVKKIIDELDEPEITKEALRKYAADNGLIIFEKSKIEEEVQRMVDEVVEAGKPVIPKFVAEWFETNKDCLADAFAFRQTTYAKKTPDERDDIDNWFANTDCVMDVLVSMKNGYEVEEEQKYNVKFKVKSSFGTVGIFLYKKGDEVLAGDNFQSYYPKEDECRLAEQEIKDYDDRFWAFAVPVEEEKE